MLKLFDEEGKLPERPGLRIFCLERGTLKNTDQLDGAGNDAVVFSTTFDVVQDAHNVVTMHDGFGEFGV